jgi:hypothetical protein
MKRVAIWNDGPVAEELGGGTRGNDSFNSAFDLALLSEEVKEFYKHMAKNDLVEMLDAIADMKFVWEGIQFKYGCTSYSYTACNLDQFYANEKAFSAIRSYYYYHFHESTDVVYEHIMQVTKDTDREAMLNLTMDTVNEVFDIVCEANEQKGTVKDSNGKTMKGPKWVNPADRIRELLIDKGILK